MNRTVGKMEKMGLITRLKGEDDQREKRVFLSEQGKEIAEKAYPVANRTLMESLRGLPIREIKICQEVLRKVFENAAD